MTEEDNLIINEAITKGFQIVECPGTAADAYQTAEVLSGASRMLLACDKDLVAFVRREREAGRLDMSKRIAGLERGFEIICGVVQELEQRNNDLLAKNVELEQRARDAEWQNRVLQLRLAGVNGVTSSGADDASFLIVDTDNFARDYPNEWVIARVYTDDERSAERARDGIYGSNPGSRWGRVVKPGYKLQPGFEP